MKTKLRKVEYLVDIMYQTVLDSAIFPEMDASFPIKNISISNLLKKTFSKPKAIKFAQRLKELTETNLDKVQISKKIMLE